MNADQTGTIGEYGFHLQQRNHVGDARHHLFTGKHLSGVGHDLFHGLAFAGSFQGGAGNIRHGFRVVELKAFLKTALCLALKKVDS